jgi:hypothetical protein
VLQLLMLVALAVTASRVRSSQLVPRRRIAVLTDTSPVADLTAPIEPPVLATPMVGEPLQIEGSEMEPWPEDDRP